MAAFDNGRFEEVPHYYFRYYRGGKEGRGTPVAWGQLRKSCCTWCGVGMMACGEGGMVLLFCKCRSLRQTAPRSLGKETRGGAPRGALFAFFLNRACDCVRRGAVRACVRVRYSVV